MRIALWSFVALGFLCGTGQAATPCDTIAAQARALGASDGQEDGVLARTGLQRDTGEWFDDFDAAFAALPGVTIDSAAMTFIFDERYLDRSQGAVALFDHRADGGFVALSQVLGSLGCLLVFRQAGSAECGRERRLAVLSPVSGSNVLEEISSMDQFHRKEPVLTVRHEFIESDQIRMRHVG